MPRYNRYQNNDPREMVSRFKSTCSVCGKEIAKGEKIIYWPIGKKAQHYKCGEKDFLQSMALIADEDNGLW